MVESNDNEIPNITKVSIITTHDHLFRPLISGLVSSTLTTVIYQPLELLKTRIQIRDDTQSNGRLFGRLRKTALSLSQDQGIGYLWRGTGAVSIHECLDSTYTEPISILTSITQFQSLLRSGPGVSLYYAFLGLLQTKLSKQSDRPDNPTQAFCFGLAARSLVSFVLLPITVVKVRYESGQFQYASLYKAVRGAYLRDGWVGVTPTVLRDSLFSGFYYMSYTELKSSEFLEQHCEGTGAHLRSFLCGIVSGIVASVATNPLDVIKTRVQVSGGGKETCARNVIKELISQPRGYLCLLDGIIPRGVRRTLIAATTWTIYEIISNKMKN